MRRLTVISAFFASATILLVPLTGITAALFTIDSQQPTLMTMDPVTGGIVDSVTIVVPGSTVTGGTGLAVDPASGELFALLLISGQSGSELATIDPATGTATSIGTISAPFAALAFDRNGRLFAVSDDTAPQPESLYEVSTSNATVTFRRILGGSESGEALGFAPTTGLLYRRSGSILQSVHPDSLILTTIPGSGDSTGEVLGLTWHPQSMHFIATTADAQLVALRTDGTATILNDGLETSSGRGTALMVSPASMVAIDPSEATLRSISRLSGEEISLRTISLAGETVLGGHGLARHPRTSTLYGLLELSSQTTSELVTIDESSGEAQSVGDTGDLFAALTFDIDANLYGVTDDLGTAPETLFTLNPTNGVATSITVLGNGSDGEALTYNSADAFLYHHSGVSPDQAFEKIHIPTLQIIPLTLSGSLYGEVTGLLHDPMSRDFIATTTSNELVSLTATGTATISAAPLNHGTDRGLAPPAPKRIAWTVDATQPILRTVDPSTGGYLSELPLSLSGATLDSGKGLSVHPTTGNIYGLMKLQGRTSFELVVIDPTTGVCTSVGDTGDKFAGITFSSDATLYAVSGEAAALPESLYTLDLQTGSATFVLALGSGGGGEAIGFNPTDGRIYHQSGSFDGGGVAIFERIDPVGLSVESITMSGAEADEFYGLSWDAEGGLFLVTTQDQELLTLTADGFATLVNSYLAPEFDRALSLPSFLLDADLAITKNAGVSSVVAGSPVTYTIAVTNSGPESALGAVVTDTMPSDLSSVTWNCTGSGGGICSPSGNGDINDIADLPAGASVTYVVSGIVSSAAVSMLTNTATVAGPGVVHDSNQSNNSAQELTTIIPQQIFTDGFEDSTTDAWSQAVP